MNYEFEYLNHLVAVIDEIHQSQKEKIKTLAPMFAQNVKDNHIIHIFGTGHSHMIGIEMYGRAGGLANINAMLDADVLPSNGARRSGDVEKLPGLADIIYNQYRITKGDIMIIVSNSGRNTVPVEMAMRAKKEGIFTIGLTNLKQSQAITSRHSSGKKLYEVVDFVLDTCVPFGDSMMEIGGAKTGPASTISAMIILHTIVNEAMQLLAKEGFPTPIIQSQNLDGFDNDAMYARYEDRVRFF